MRPIQNALVTGAMALSAALACTRATAENYIALAIADSSIYAGDINRNYCGDSALVIGEAGGEWRSVVKWDIIGANKVPAGSTINSVRIAFYRQCTSATGSIFLRFYRNESNWSECAVNWANRPSTSFLVGDYPVSECSGSSQWIEFQDSGNALRDWVQDLADGDDNYGLTLRANPATGGLYQLFRSHRDTPARMYIDYTPPAAAQPDLTVTLVDAENGPIALCTDIDVQVRVQNVGDGNADAYDIQCVASTNTTWGGGDYNLGNQNFANLAPGASRTHTLTLPVDCDIPRNDYYILARVTSGDDPNSSNDVGFDPVQVVFEHAPNLAVTSVSTDATEYVQGEPMMVSFSVENEGGIASSSTTYTVVLSSDSGWGSDAQIWGPFSLPSVAGYSTLSRNRSVTIGASVPDGEYYVGVRVEDDGGPEDTRFTGPVWVGPMGGCDPADLVEPFGHHDFFDVQEFLNLWASHDPAGDLVPDGRWDFFDLQFFLNEFADGCP